MNGREFSKSGHEGTVEAMRKEPIVVQVLRRGPSGRNQNSLQEVCVVDVCTQTDITFEHIMALAKMRPTTPPVPDICPFLLSDRYSMLPTQLITFRFRPNPLPVKLIVLFIVCHYYKKLYYDFIHD